MDVDVFGYHVNKKRKIDHTVCGLKYTCDNNLDAENKTIKNIGNPIDLHDCVTKKYVDELANISRQKIADLNQFITELKNQISSIKNIENEQRKRGKRNT